MTEEEKKELFNSIDFDFFKIAQYSDKIFDREFLKRNSINLSNYGNILISRFKEKDESLIEYWNILKNMPFREFSWNENKLYRINTDSDQYIERPNCKSCEHYYLDILKESNCDIKPKCCNGFPADKYKILKEVNFDREKFKEVINKKSDDFNF